jgi:hypothetical protein
VPDINAYVALGGSKKPKALGRLRRGWLTYFDGP